MTTSRILAPEPGEYAPYYQKYVDKVSDDILGRLESQHASTHALLERLTEQQAMFRYAPGKWSVKEVVGHLIDAERVFAYRALRFARADATELPGFDENAWVPEGRFDTRSIADLAAEFAAVRAATLALFHGLPESTHTRRGVANGNPMSVRALAMIMAGHEAHHVALLRERYGVE